MYMLNKLAKHGSECANRCRFHHEIGLLAEVFKDERTNARPAHNMRLLTWNVNGLRAVVASHKRGGLRELLESTQADIVCLQETKLRRSELTPEVALLDGWHSFFDFAAHKTGYSGVATFCKHEIAPCAAQRGLVGDSATHVAHLPADEIDALDAEGRCIVTDHGAFVLFNVYIPALSCEDKAEVRRNQINALLSAGFVATMSLRHYSPGYQHV